MALSVITYASLVVSRENRRCHVKIHQPKWESQSVSWRCLPRAGAHINLGNPHAVGSAGGQDGFSFNLVGLGLSVQSRQCDPGPGVS